MLEMPRLKYIGNKYPNVMLEKVAIDWSTHKIRGTLPLYTRDNHPNIKRKNQRRVVWFSFDDIGELLVVM